MFQGFSKHKADRPAKIDPGTNPFAAFLKKPSTAAAAACVEQLPARDEGSKQDKNAQNQTTSAAATANHTLNNRDHNGNTTAPLFVPSNSTAKRDDDDFSDTCGSHFGSSNSSSSSPPITEETAAVPEPTMDPSSAGLAGFRVFSRPAFAPVDKARPSPSTDSGTVTARSSASLSGTAARTGDGSSSAGGNSAPPPVNPSTLPLKWTDVPKKLPLKKPEEKVVVGPTTAKPIFAPVPYSDEDEMMMKPDAYGFRGKAAPPPEFSSTTMPSAYPQPLRDRSDHSAASSVVSFGSSRTSVDAAAAGAARLFRNAMNESVRTTSPKTSPNTSPPSQPQQRQSMRSAAAAGTRSAFGTSSTDVPPPDPTMTTSAVVVEPPRRDSDFDRASFGIFKSEGGGGFPGFGTMKRAVAPEPTPSAPATGSGFGFFGTASKAPATVFAPSSIKEDTVAQKSGGFGFGENFGTLNGGVSVFEPAAAAPKTMPDLKCSSSAFGGFGNEIIGRSGVTSLTTQKEEESLENDFASFRPLKSQPPQESVDKVRIDFGTLHVSGPPDMMKVLAEREKSEAAEMEKKRATRRVHFEEDDDRKENIAPATAAAAVNNVPQAREEQEAAPANADDSQDTDTDDDSEPKRHFPWGVRMSLRKKLEGGKKKLVLVSAPPVVSKYFNSQVFRSYGCTYDNVLNTFYATSPGKRGARDGEVVALDGSIKKDPVFLTKSLAQPAAIAVYEPGLSVCTVTDAGIYVLTRTKKEQGDVYLSRQISHRPYHRGIAATAGGGIVSFNNGRIWMFDGNVGNGQERVLAEANYDAVINDALFSELPNRRMEKSNCCFMDIVHNRLVMSDLQKHVISLWDIEETEGENGCAINFLRAIDVAICANPGRGRPAVGPGRAIPLGKCAYASGIRLDCEGWVICADAEGRTIQIYDDQLNFVTRVESAERLPYMSGLYLEAGGHLMVCDRRSEMGDLRVYLLEAKDNSDGSNSGAQQQPKKTLGFAAATRQQ